MDYSHFREQKRIVIDAPKAKEKKKDKSIDWSVIDSMEEDVSTIINSLPISNQKILKGKLESYIKDNVVTSMEYVFLDSIIRTLNERLEPKVHAVAK